MALLALRDLSVSIGKLTPLDGISLEASKGEILGIVGESGSGKSLTATAVMGLLGRVRGKVARGAILFDGQDLVGLAEPAYRRLRGKRIALISQNPMTSLDPIVTIGAQIDQVSRLHLNLSRRAATARSIELMHQLRIPEAETLHKAYPHQLSGGMKQRIVIAMALAADADLIIADEPTTALARPNRHHCRWSVRQNVVWRNAREYFFLSSCRARFVLRMHRGSQGRTPGSVHR